MAKLTNMFKGKQAVAREVHKALHKVDKEKTPIRLEIEGQNVHFYSVLSVRKDLVVVAKPAGLKKGLEKNSFVRFRVYSEPPRDIRMEIVVPHFNLLSGNFCFLCTVPKVFAEPSKRGSDRFNTSRFKNLHLFLEELNSKFRIVDISRQGCKIFAEHEGIARLLKLGQPFTPAAISIGNKVNIGLESVIPRSANGKTVGIQFKLSTEVGAQKYLTHFLKSLESAEIQSLQADSI